MFTNEITDSTSAFSSPGVLLTSNAVHPNNSFDVDATSGKVAKLIGIVYAPDILVTDVSRWTTALRNIMPTKNSELAHRIL